MEGKTQGTAAAKAGMSVRSARKWQSGPCRRRRNRSIGGGRGPDPFDYAAVRDLAESKLPEAPLLTLAAGRT